MSEPERYFQRGFGLKEEASQSLNRDYASGLVDLIRSRGSIQVDRVTFKLAKEFGFCYGVERAVEYAYETRAKFPDRRVFLTNELIHNPHVNGRMTQLGIEFLEGYDEVSADDVVVIPAFGVTVEEMQLLKDKGCIMVDTTCGSVLNVWKNVDRYSRDGYTTIIHGKYTHEETRATCSRSVRRDGSHYLVVRDMEETELVARFIETAGDASVLRERFQAAVSEGFDPDLHLGRIGLANQTTMLMSESLAIAERLRQAFLARYGEQEVPLRFRTFDTICSATQDRQDAVEDLLADRPDLMVVVGGFNSSNTNHLAEMCADRVPAYHIEDESFIIDAERIRHKPVGRAETEIATRWLPDGAVTIGLTAGASTPNNKIGLVTERILEVLDLAAPEVPAPAPAESEPLPIVG